MIERKKGKVNELMYDITVFASGKYHHYLSFYDLIYLIDRIIACGECTESITFNPFFIREKGYIELDDYMCYIECTDDKSRSSEEFIVECINQDESIEEAKEHYALCKNLTEFHDALNRYKRYIKKKIPLLAEMLRAELNLTDEDFYLGYFAFETYSI